MLSEISVLRLRAGWYETQRIVCLVRGDVEAARIHAAEARRLGVALKVAESRP